MFNVGGGEILVILLVALVVLGPEKLPGAMRTVGGMIGELRKLSNGFQSEMRNAMYTDERPPTIGPIVGSPTVADEPPIEAPEQAPGPTDAAVDEARRANEGMFRPPSSPTGPAE
jgi:sec-independent protein translocase protein TatB